jgi:hypothetical protein
MGRAPNITYIQNVAHARLILHVRTMSSQLCKSYPRSDCTLGSGARTQHHIILECFSSTRTILHSTSHNFRVHSTTRCCERCPNTQCLRHDAARDALTYKTKLYFNSVRTMSSQLRKSYPRSDCTLGFEARTQHNIN